MLVLRRVDNLRSKTLTKRGFSLFQAEGNELYNQGKFVQAMNKYSEVGFTGVQQPVAIDARPIPSHVFLTHHIMVQAIAIFRYWNREMVGRDQNLVYYKDDDKCEGDDRQKAQKFIVSVLLNAAACILKIQNSATPREVVWTCTEVLDLDKSSVKAYYRRAIAYGSMDSSLTLELAVKDLTKAVQLAPEDKVGTMTRT